MATAELARPGVEVIQSFQSASPTFLRPTLAPVVVGPAFEVIDILTADGTLSAKAKHGPYTQLGKVITHSSFPNPRGNIDELDILLSTVRPYLLTGGRLTELAMTEGAGEGFLLAAHVSSKAVFRTAGTSFAVGGKNLVLAVDQPVPLDNGKDVTVTFPGTSALSPQQVVDAINLAFGVSIASVTYDTAVPPQVTGFQLASPTTGAMSSLTVRAGGTANQLLALGWVGGAAKEERVEGAGFRAQDQANNTTQSTWIEFFRGDYYADGKAASVPANSVSWPSGRAGLVNIIDGEFRSDRATDMTFGGNNTVPIAVGDQVFVDGSRLKGGEITKVDQRRFKIGTINTLLSTADQSGRYTSKVYTDAPVGTLLDAAPFAPKYVWFKATGLSPSASATAASLTGTAAALAATKAIVTGPTAPDFSSPIALSGLQLSYIVTVDGVATPGTFTFTGGPYADMAAVATAIGSSIPGVEAEDNGGGKLKLSTLATGRLQSLVVKKDGSVNAALGLDQVDDASATGLDARFTNLTGLNLQFSFNNGAHIYDVTFNDDSLNLAVDTINSFVGATVASMVVVSPATTPSLKITSPLAAVSSKVTIAGGSALTDLGFTTAAVSAGQAGRPSPDAYIDDTGNLVIGAEINRDPVTGYPLDFSTSPATLYVQFKALRKDVSPAARVSGVLRLPDVDTLTSVMDPITEENPGAFGTYLTMLNCPGFEVKFLGVDEVSGAAPEGTELAYARAASFLEAEEVYAIAPLTQNEVVHGLFTTHATLMSEPEQGGERIVLFNKKMPVRKNPKIVVSGTDAASTATANQLILDVTPQAGLVEAKIDATGLIPASVGLYVEFSWEGELFRYNVQSVSGGLVNFRVSFSGDDNVDAFYTDVTLPTGMVNVSWSMKVRGDSLQIPGSNPVKLDYSLVADTVSEMNGGIGNRRAYSVFPDVIKTTIAGVEKTLPGYYACAAIAGMIAGQPPSQGFTNYPIVGLTGVVGTEKFTRRQLNRMAGGGTYILMQEVQGGAVFSRHQLSTDLTSIETRELSITKVVDFVAKFLRTGVRRFIGRQNINAVFLDTVGTTIQGMLSFLVENGIINGANLNNIIQDKKAPDTVLLDITLDVPFPCNYIRLTLVV